MRAVACLVVAFTLVVSAGARAAGGSGGASTAPTATPPAVTAPPATRHGVGELVIAITDPTRTVRFPHRAPAPRTLVTLIRYPTAPTGSPLDARDAAPDRTGGPYPLIVFAHGYDATPARYTALLRAWTEAGYVVAAPIFPLTNARTPGGPRESDLLQQPRDMSVVMTRLLALTATGHGILGGLIDSRHIAVAGQSDGGSTALAAADDIHTVDRRIGAAVILSGARIPGLAGYTFPAPAPPLLAVQGTRDDSNAPASTRAYFRPAPVPKYLLWLWGADHLGPYTDEQPQLGIVETVTVAFLDRYLKLDPTAVGRMYAAGDAAGVSDLTTRTR